ncbi:hypothetical protein [Candidatus Poriferisocius sp.]|uniref:hypothetical protein n=1 Tax=Candidatus Poriferisocius sp. TaxID=3101276 RepID=UPI003B52B0F2
MLGTLALGRSIAHLLIALAVVASLLVVVPLPSGVPLVGDSIERADAHDKKSCRWVSYQTQARARGADGEWTTKTVTRQRWVCTSVAHTHRWEGAARWAGTHLACAGFSAAVGGATFYGTRHPAWAGSVTGTTQRGCTRLINNIGN